MAIEPTAVTPQESREIAPTWAMFVGSMMIPEPIMLTATMTVSWIRFIFFRGSSMVSPCSLPQLSHSRRRSAPEAVEGVVGATALVGLHFDAGGIVPEAG